MYCYELKIGPTPKLIIMVKVYLFNERGTVNAVGVVCTSTTIFILFSFCLDKQNRREKKVLLFIMLFLLGNIYFVYYVFWEQRLHNW